MKGLAKLFLVVLALFGLGLAGGGGWLIALGGSPYYLIIGLVWLLAAWLLWQGRSLGADLVAFSTLVTALWRLWEVGADFWAMFPRLMAPLALTVCALLFTPMLTGTSRPGLRYGGVAIAGALFIVGFALAFVPHGIVRPGEDITPYKLAEGDHTPENWTAYARDTRGQRYSAFGQINRETVKDLQPAWTFRTGRGDIGIDQNTPLQIDDLVYTCTTSNVISALDADTGAERWRFDPKASGPFWQRCRGLGSYETPAAQQVDGQLCNTRLIETTIDARLIAIDAKTGALCPDFGKGGEVALSEGLGEIIPGFYFQTSAPLVARDKIVIGGWVVDNQMVGEPSGVIRAFNVITGELEWAWDLGNPAITKLPPEGGTYTHGTPNM